MLLLVVISCVHAALLPTFVWSVLKTGLWFRIQLVSSGRAALWWLFWERGSLCDVKPLLVTSVVGPLPREIRSKPSKGRPTLSRIYS